MHSWLFYLTDSLGTMIAVVGDGDTRTDAEAAALANWESLTSSREDYGARSPIVEVIYAEISTETGSDDLPKLLL